MTTVTPDDVWAWREVATVDVTRPYWIHRAGYAEWSGTRTRRHTHSGFAELFWVECGRAVHEVDGSGFPLTVGDLVFVASTDVHRFRGASPDFAIVNLAIPDDVLGDVLARYGPEVRSPWHRSHPRVGHLAAHDWARLRELGNALGHGRQSRLRVDHFLIELLMMLDGPVPTTGPMPDWLAAALRQWRDDPVAMQDGVSGIAHLARRSREHVSRVIKQSTGSRAVDVVNALRIEHAAALLRMSDHPIVRIAAECGLPNLSHFYTVFRQHFDTTPRQYRLSQRRATNPLD